jgi:fructoselysine-6-P-deglycase FrlB-like protein
MKNPPVVISDSTDEAEAQLQALIAECRQIIREVVVPAAEAAEEGGERRRYLDSAIALVRVANATGDTIARLRGGVQEEFRQKIIVERVERTAAALLDIPRSVRAGARHACPQVDKPGEGGP